MCAIVWKIAICLLWRTKNLHCHKEYIYINKRQDNTIKYNIQYYKEIFFYSAAVVMGRKVLFVCSTLTYCNFPKWYFLWWQWGSLSVFVTDSIWTKVCSTYLVIIDNNYLNCYEASESKALINQGSWKAFLPRFF